jgi:hypothetical protein
MNNCPNPKKISNINNNNEEIKKIYEENIIKINFFNDS